jgi:hypothetical protein
MRKIYFLFFLLIISCNKDPIIYTLTTISNPIDGGMVSPNNKQYEDGEIASITATPASEYVFESWTGAQETSSSIKVLMISDKSVIANFIKKKYPLTVEIEGEGTLTEKVIKAGAATDYNSGTVIELTATPSDEWEFKEWSGDLTGTDNPKEITIDMAKTVKAVFVKKQYSLNIEVLGEGTVEKKVIKQGLKSDYNSGSIIELTAKSDNGWKFVKWDGDAKSFQNKIQITVNKKINLIVEFANTNQDFGYNKNTIIQGYGVVWGMDVLGVDEIIFTERSGKIYLFKSGIINELNGFPNEKINAVGQHGLLDVLKHPNYKENGFIYAVFSEKVEGFGTSKLNLVRFKLE